jgi:hypothetical protein
MSVKIKGNISGLKLEWTFDALDEDYELEQVLEGVLVLR